MITTVVADGKTNMNLLICSKRERRIQIKM